MLCPEMMPMHIRLLASILNLINKYNSLKELYHTVRGVTVPNLKVQELQYSYSWNDMLCPEMMPMHIPLLCINIKSNQQVQ